MNKGGTVFGGSLLVAGTAIGGGMLALPVLTSLGGFVPSIFIFILCWLFMTCTALLLLEVSLWMGKESNIISMASRTLGVSGQFAAWALYIFQFFTLTIAYISGSGNLIVEFLGVPEWAGILLFVLLFAPFVYIGAQAVDKINALLMVGLGISYFAFIFLGAPHVKKELLFDQHSWSLSLLALPVAFTSFGFQGIIPTLVTYLNFDVKKLRSAIFIGSTLPLITYIIWQILIEGIIPTHGPGGLIEALKNNFNAVRPLKEFIHNPWIISAGNAFAFFALVTSFLGVTLALRDFLADGLHVKKDSKGKLLLCAMIFLPTMLFSMIYPYVFLEALGYAGGFGCALLLGLLPVLMVWRARYHLGSQVPKQLPGGKALLILLVLFIAFEIGCEITYIVGKY